MKQMFYQVESFEYRNACWLNDAYGAVLWWCRPASFGKHKPWRIADRNRVFRGV